ncbi:MAG: glycosyltransferase family 2 protein [bacterium]|nr:glycosyltransferase family 2 protein [bacterium]
MTVSVIIPVYNEEETIEDALMSLNRQTRKPAEIIVVDDGSEDSSKLKVQSSKLQLKTQNFIILEQQHKGPGAARNLGAKHAKGDILVFVDADMTFAPDFLEKLIKPIEAKETIGTFTKDERVSNWDNVWARCWNWNEGWPPKYRIPKDFPNEAMVFRAILRSAFESVGGFDEDCGYTDDWSLSRKLGKRSTAVLDATVYHTNPDTLSEVWAAARWIGRGEFLRRSIKSLVRFSFPTSLAIGVMKAFRFREPWFFVFKIVYDAGIFISVVESFVWRETAK